MADFQRSGRKSDRGGKCVNLLLDDEKVRRFLSNVCAQVRAKDLHSEIRAELTGHIEDLVERAEAKGMSREEAIAQAISQMGNPAEIGRDLHKAHRPQIEWGMLAIIGVLTALGLFAMFALDSAQLQNRGMRTIGISFMMTQLKFILIGLLAAAGVWFLDYRKLQRFSVLLFVGTVFLLLFTTSQRNSLINGSLYFLNIGEFSFNAVNFSLYGFLIAAAGMNFAKIRSLPELLFRIGLCGFLPLFIYFQMNSYMPALIYTIGFASLLYYTRRKWWPAAVFIAPVAVAGLFLIAQKPHLYNRLISISSNSGKDNNYQTMNSIEAIQSGGWFGKGFGVWNNTLPAIYSEAILPYLMYAFGWIMGIIIITLALIFITRLAQIIKRIEDSYGRSIVFVISVLITIQFLWTILMSIGLVPYTSISLPFISFGGSQLLLHYVSFGLVLSVYKRIHMIPKLSTG